MNEYNILLILQSARILLVTDIQRNITKNSEWLSGLLNRLTGYIHSHHKIYYYYLYTYSN